MRGELTPAWDSANTTFWEEYSDIAFVVANSLILLITCAVGIAANLFVILAVYQQKALQTVNNALVVNLAVIDLLRCVIDCPILLTIVITVNHRGHVHQLICDTQVASFSFSCCIQLLTLASISAERYQAIARPFTTTQRRRRIMVAEQSETKPFKAEQPNPCGTEFEAKLSNGDAAASVKSSTTKPQKVSSNFNSERQSKERVNIDEVPSEMKEASPHVHSSAQLENPEPTFVLLIEPKQDKSNNGGETLNVSTADQGSSLPPGSSNVPEAEATKQDAQVEGAVCMMPSKASRERASKKKESKMAKRAGYIIITFLLFWLPLIITILINRVVHGNKNPQVKVIKEVEILSVSVTCITSLSNPIIYAAVNPQFRTEFYRLKTKCVSRFTKK
ncbi:5-hydroxytryptamine receptor 1A [Dissostichus eleginoides]|uniref:5-hydroxytryptamine receptor 1A n=1 Tax=Dissostichus eleginoides TaxID=100907 RepID=A0AAD9BSE8_DISEL|nr:5-hydroxytryptamine receptor 1A [Dissostichus eleginoides]